MHVEVACYKKLTRDCCSNGEDGGEYFYNEGLEYGRRKEGGMH